MRRHRDTSTCAALLGAALVVSLPAAPASACDAPGVSCSSEAAPPAAQAASRDVPATPARPIPPRPTPRVLNPNGYNQNGERPEEVAEILRQLQRARAEANAERRR